MAKQAAKSDTAQAPASTLSTVECCPQLEPCNVCDVLNFSYRLPFRVPVFVQDRQQVVSVEVTLHFRLTRCSGSLAQGDLLYTTTLLPGEKVRLFSSDRHTRFSYDSETKLSYYNETTSEESYYAAGMAYGMSDLNVLDTTHTDSSFSSQAVSGGASAGFNVFGLFGGGASASFSNYDANSAANLAHSLSQHAESLHQHMEVSTRAASSTSIGEVATRNHQQGESDDQYESASRTFSNPNHCHAVTFLFYRINKCQTVKFELVSIDRRVNDPLAPTSVSLNPPAPATKVAVRSSLVLATGADRPGVARRANESVTLEQGGGATGALFARGIGNFPAQGVIAVNARQAALQQVDEELVQEGLLDKVGGKVSPNAQKTLGWEQHLALPTPGVLVKGCLDDCDICEPELKRLMDLEATRKDLENQLLKKQIDLLEKSQEYRCCPAGETEEAGA
jgi:hypothetical protein